MNRLKRRSPFGPMWVSHNKVLIGSGGGYGSKKPHARNPNFDSEETKLLIQLWGDPQVQRALITTHKKHPVIAKIAEKMRAFGYQRSTEEINTRIKNLKCLYNRIKKDMDAGNLLEPSWKHYSAMDEILSRPVFGASNKVPQPHLVNQQAKTDGETSSETQAIVEDKSSVDVQIKEEKQSDGEMEDDDEDFDDDDNSNDLKVEDFLHVEQNDDVEETVIKEEPVDLDEKDEAGTDEKETSDNVPKKVGNLNLSNNIINYATDSNLSITSVVSNAGNLKVQPGTQNQSQNQNQTANKISLVPTKLLLKPQQQTVTQQFKQPTLIYSSPGNQNIVTSANSSSIPMKVVFVNTNMSNAGNNKIHTLNKTIATLQQAQPQQIQQLQQIPVQKIQQIQQQPIQKDSSHLNNGETSQAGGSVRNKVINRERAVLSNKFPVIKNMLNGILTIEKQRLEIEKERFEYEKSVGNEILQMMRMFLNPKAKEDNESAQK